MPIVKMPDGVQVRFPDDMPREQIRDLIASKYPDAASGVNMPEAPAVGVAQDQTQTAQGGMELKPTRSPVDYLRSGLQGATFGLSDEAVAAMGAPALAALGGRGLGEAYGELLARERQALRERGSTLAEMAGSVAGGGALGSALGKVAPQTMQGIQTYARTGFIPRTAAYAGTGAGAGALYGFGTGEGGFAERATSAVEAGGVGGLFGAGASGVQELGQQAAMAARPLTQRVMRLFSGRQPAQMPAVPPASVQEAAEQAVTQSVPAAGEITDSGLARVQRAIRRDFPDNYEQVLEAWKQGDEALVETYGGKLRQLAKGTAQYEPGQTRAEAFFGTRLARTPDEIDRTVSQNISGVQNFYKTADDIVEAGREKARPLYDRAYAGVVGEIELKPEVVSALKRARAKYPSELQGVDDSSVKALDYAKRVLDDDIEKSIRAGQNNLARSRTQLRNELLEQIDDQVPAYAQAREASGDYLRVKQSMDNGANFMQEPPELLQQNFNKLSAPEKTAYRIGVGKRIRDLVDNTPENQNPFNRILGKPSNQKRLKAILNETEYAKLSRDLRAEDRLFKLRNEILGNSATQSKGQAMAEVAGAFGDMSQIASGNVTPQSAIGGVMRRMFDGLSEQRAKEISDVLFETDPSRKLEIYNKLLQKPMTRVEKTATRQAFAVMDNVMRDPEFKTIVPLVAGAMGGQFVQSEKERIQKKREQEQ